MGFPGRLRRGVTIQSGREGMVCKSNLEEPLEADYEWTRIYGLLLSVRGNFVFTIRLRAIEENRSTLACKA